MHDKRRLSDAMLFIIKGWANQFTKEESFEDDIDPFENMSNTEIYLAGMRDGKTELSRDILEHQDLINYN